LHLLLVQSKQSFYFVVDWYSMVMLYWYFSIEQYSVVQLLGLTVLIRLYRHQLVKDVCRVAVLVDRNNPDEQEHWMFVQVLDQYQLQQSFYYLRLLDCIWHKNLHNQDLYQHVVQQQLYLLVLMYNDVLLNHTPQNHRNDMLHYKRKNRIHKEKTILFFTEPMFEVEICLHMMEYRSQHCNYT
jgi:hypothetical protein